MDNDYGTLRGLRDLLKKQQEEKQMSKPYTGVKNEKPELNAAQHAINDMAKQPTHLSVSVPTPDGQTAPGLMVRHNFADGGEVQDPMAFLSNGYMMPSGQAAPPAPVPPAPAPVAPPTVPPLNAVAASLNKTPDTDYNFFKNLSAEDRAALQQKLIEQQNSAPSMVAQGLAGLGDAISNSYGGRNTSFQKDVMANNEAQQAKQIGAFDTQRTQKLQDMNANMEMQANDPKSPLSQAMQRIAKSQGVPVPSGMPASMMVKVLGPLGELAMKQATMELQKQTTQAQQEIARQGQRNQATESLAKMGPIDRFFHKDEVDQLKKASGIAPIDHGIPDLGQTFNGGKVTKVTRIK